MIKKNLLSCLILLVGVSVFAQPQQQQRRHGRPSVLIEITPQSVYQEVFPEATDMIKVDDYWYKIVNAKGKTLGFALNSSNHLPDVRGYAGVTPILIITDKQHVIQKVGLLSHYESPNFIQRLVVAGFFNNWNGLKVKEAKKDKVDGYTGATMTANAVSNNLNYMIEKGSKKLPK